MFATGMTCSNEQLIMDEEISAMSLRIAEGIGVNDDTVALPLIKAIGPGSAGEGYLTADHTMRWLRAGEYLEPRVSVRGSRAIWESGGARDTYGIARDRVRELGALPRIGIDGMRKARLDEIVRGLEN
jgi:trimethylamine--corrinoid protein Co-methyltransferase